MTASAKTVQRISRLLQALCVLALSSLAFGGPADAAAHAALTDPAHSIEHALAKASETPELQRAPCRLRTPVPARPCDPQCHFALGLSGIGALRIRERAPDKFLAAAVSFPLFLRRQHPPDPIRAGPRGQWLDGPAGPPFRAAFARTMRLLN